MANTKQTTRPRVGDSCWFVEWCSELAFYGDDPNGDVDRDNCKMARRKAASREEAVRLAREVYRIATTTFGVVEFWPATFVAYDDDDAIAYPHAGYWKADADPDYYEGHVHSRSCYDDPGPGHGSPSVICGMGEGDPEPAE
jgi:hypothetical protein